MVFSSGIFLFFFLPAVLIIYKLSPGIKLKNLVLFIASLVFYSFGQPAYLLLFLFSIIVNTLFGYLIGKRGRYERVFLIFAIIINLTLLCSFKYLDLFINTINSIFSLSIPKANIPLPIGISFYTFQGLSYIIDMYRNKEMRSGSFLKIGLYISLFPQLIAGPIVIYTDITHQIDSRNSTFEMTAQGIRRFIIGLSKKLLIANTLGSVVDGIYALDSRYIDLRLAWIAALFYALQIYFDFSGYTDMALGLGKMFGFVFPENFNYPYASTGIKQFWRRWHISLSSWFRDYLYIPLGGNRKGRWRTLLNKVAVFFFTGLWHGASWTFVIWGLWHGLFIILEDLITVKSKAIKALSHIYVLLVVVVGFVLFRADTIYQAGIFISNMFTGFSFSSESTLSLYRLLNPVVITVLLVSIPAALPTLPALRNKIQTAPAIAKTANILSYGSAAALMLLCMMNLASTSFNPFIYFRF